MDKEFMNEIENEDENAPLIVSVVDEDGEPLIVYHGTQAKPFSVIGENQKGLITKKKRTFYFSTSVLNLGHT